MSRTRQWFAAYEQAVRDRVASEDGCCCGVEGCDGTGPYPTDPAPVSTSPEPGADASPPSRAG